MPPNDMQASDDSDDPTTGLRTMTYKEVLREVVRSQRATRAAMAQLAADVARAVSAYEDSWLKLARDIAMLPIYRGSRVVRGANNEETLVPSGWSIQLVHVVVIILLVFGLFGGDRAWELVGWVVAKIPTVTTTPTP